MKKQMARKSKKQKDEEAKAAEEVTTEAEEVVETEAEEVVETETEETSPEAEDEEVTTEAEEASKSDSADSLRKASNKKKLLKICDYQCDSYEDQKVRGAVELHYRSRGLRFRGSSVTQEKLNLLLKDGSFGGKLGYLRKHVKRTKNS